MYDEGLGRNEANYVPLSPLSYLSRAAQVFPDTPAIVYGALRQDWRATYIRCRRLASALQRHGVRKGDTVSVLLPNVPAMFEAHFGVPMAGAVINTLNTRLDSDSIAFMLRHSEAKVLLMDPEYSAVVERALASVGALRPLLISVDDPTATPSTSITGLTYESFLATGDPDAHWRLPDDEWDAIALNYTSGSTGNPKGVVTHHRGAYLNAAGNAHAWQMPHHPRYLWTLPMFHCNGWCFPWTLALMAGTSICLRRVDAAEVFRLIREHEVTHLCGAPIVYSTLLNAPIALRAGIHHTVRGMIAGAAPPVAVLEQSEAIGFCLTHVYGLTEVYGPSAICAPQIAWETLPSSERARLIGRQGVPYAFQEAVNVFDPISMAPVPADGTTMGEVFFRGNAVMKGYLKNPDATREAFAHGWFHTGDLAVVHRDGYIKLKDRSKDVIISGGENISSLEVEDALHRHPAVLLAAVVAQPDAKWGEVPCAFVELKAGAEVTPAALIAFCRQELAHFKIPKRIVFAELPKTATGKVQKFILRTRVKSASAID
jgi:fatty-acyl-CoA synthase